MARGSGLGEAVGGRWTGGSGLRVVADESGKSDSVVGEKGDRRQSEGAGPGAQGGGLDSKRWEVAEELRIQWMGARGDRGVVPSTTGPVG